MARPITPLVARNHARREDHEVAGPDLDVLVLARGDRARRRSWVSPWLPVDRMTWRSRGQLAPAPRAAASRPSGTVR